MLIRRVLTYLKIELKLSHDAKLDDIVVKLDRMASDSRANQDRIIDRLTALEVNQSDNNRAATAILAHLGTHTS